MKGILVVLKKKSVRTSAIAGGLQFFVTGTDSFSSAINWNDMARHLSPD